MAELGSIVVTGGSRGIGAAICRKLAADGYAVMVNYAGNRAKADEVVDAIRKAGGKAVAYQADVVDEGQVEAMFATAVKELGPLSGLVTNAGLLGPIARVDEYDAAEMRRLFDVNITGLILCCKYAIRRLSTKHGGKGGSIVNMGSVAARLGGAARLAPYAASKGAVETFTRGLANEIAAESIRVNAVSPGVINTEMTEADIFSAAVKTIPMGRKGEPHEVADAVSWLMSPGANFVTGTIVTVSGGR
ncbi:MAG TPA: SDR family oxidoreductase [Stellaceae bacterium]|nr:SDR family oxidoreductase [Stellaceae bacterium]